MSKTRPERLIEVYRMKKHAEGGHFSEAFTSSENKDGRALAGSIFFLLDKDEISCLHEIDCEEIWFYHEGCGLKITVLDRSGGREELLLGGDPDKGERAAAVVPKGRVFAAENTDKRGFTFVSCATSPQFSEEGCRLVTEEELKREFPEYAEELKHLCIE